MKANSFTFFVVMFSFVATSVCQAMGTEDDTAKLVHLDSVERADLNGAVSVAISSDGLFLYASAFKAASHVVCSRELETGKLTHVQTLQDADRLQGATSLRLSQDGRFAVAAAFTSKTISL